MFLGRATDRRAAKPQSPPAGPAVIEFHSQCEKRAILALDVGRDRLLEILKSEHPRRWLAVDEKRRRRLHPELDRSLPHVLEAVDHGLVLEALVERLLAHAGLLSD